MEEHEKMMFFLLGKYKLLNQKDDYMDLCYIGYVKALNTFKEDKKASFSSYAYSCMENELKQELRKKKMKKRQREELSLDYIIDDQNDVYELISNNYNLEEECIKNESEKNIRKAISILDEQERSFIEDIYINNLNKNEIASKYHIGISKINCILESAYNKLKVFKTYKYLQ
jgi:RNA polymerase sporulation-specific sigma factor